MHCEERTRMDGNRQDRKETNFRESDSTEFARENRYLLDLFITHWTEPWDIGKKAFDMLGLQRTVRWEDVRVWLVHDGVPAFPEKYFAGLPFPVHQIELPHGGIAAARNWGIDHGNGEWIKWCDFDDMFYGIYSLRRLMDAMERGQNFDMMWFDMTAEDSKDGKGVWLRTDRDPVLIHGKAFRRDWLKEHGIRYNEELTWCEDSAFLAVCEMECDIKRVGHVACEAPIYAWIVRDGSLCNRPEIRFDNMKSFFKRHKYVQEEFRKRGLMGPYYTMTVRIMGDCYRHLFMEDVQNDTTEYRRDILEYWKEHREDFFKVDRERYELALKAVEEESRFEKKGVVYAKKINREDFRAWLRSMTKEIREIESAKPEDDKAEGKAVETGEAKQARGRDDGCST